ncbi:hypothetical protein X797_011144 [Metarhizium robertsii]|uniref:Uncharacterized protein n=1 Tax=Metarhizium robertsii TaxID=568076 RepID=A0A014QSN4_9HYPO|nr:hypothetical protein X797_011144 [Metarhizium robertsii]
MQCYIIALLVTVVLGSPQGYPSFGSPLWENPTLQNCAWPGDSCSPHASNCCHGHCCDLPSGNGAVCGGNHTSIGKFVILFASTFRVKASRNSFLSMSLQSRKSMVHCSIVEWLKAFADMEKETAN